ncbi:copper/silver-translocating P-type ATPase,heavy metal-translocating P-type ATPase, Cd/Co/Hg/Pb/Zn-transporting [Methanomethylovorans hollandica DSM 15978]|uniref:Copper/silver-translocating P-type ATPase,heavy metal-translocating P-type ATPase, Cd/Co/Hg/Pb/Zn-transporting n=1 Tax=Methanomethylovorans hollandica (strain DSM 15978 / NBRC 107637 / DMS1) TaxID=867904 RepID=L0KXT3_METHD|nr:heavy metal translocating P-type ATPase [Methanomethylovorans hollandica]AGB48873.1 copper/silver-translocating P-type ATPase,heavy metal-translocating P-type ATPase, Cd/Co/Hg/Pb/Zn-transporting [Methanomethylovorans hollandica DSM 15978]
MTQSILKVINKQKVVFQVDGITCLDCAQKFEKAVNELPGVLSASLNTMTGKLTVEGMADLAAIRRLGQDENYTINPMEQVKNKAPTVFQVDGITCLDCAQKFEKAVNELPGVLSASLNTMTGKLAVEGRASLEDIRQLGQDENYKINPVVQQRSIAQPVKKINWEMLRAVLSGVSLVIAVGVEKFGGSATAYLPMYILAMVLGGWGNFKKASHALPRLNFNMSVLMSVAVIGAFAIGQYEEGATVAFLYAISEMLQAWTVEKARRSIRQLMDIAPKTALLRRSGSEVETSVEQINIDDIMIVYPGEKIAMDGEIVKGESAINEAAITGESIPADKGPGAEVFAGTLNTHGSIEVKVTKLVQDTTIAKIIHMVEEAQSKRAPSQVFVEKFATVYTPIVMALAMGFMFLPPLLLGYEWTPWIYRGLTLLVVACPCALVVSTPVAIVSAISNAAKNGVLIKGGIHLEEAGSLNAIAFDKTGTLTKGEAVVTDIIPVGSTPENKLLQMAANLEARSEHPLAVAIIKAAQQRGHQVVPVEDFTAIAGRGAHGTINAQRIYIGNPRMFIEKGISLEPVIKEIERLQGQGKTVMIVGTPNTFLGIIAVADEVRENSTDAVTALKSAGIQHTIMLTGDNDVTAKAMSAKVGVDEYRAELLPQDKVTVVQELLGKYNKVGMIGDGINDAPALALSTVGIAMGGAGTDTALETADIVLMADDLSKLPFTIRLSRKALAIIHQNIGFSLIIKAIAILAIFPGWLTLWMAILADMGATIIVTLNSLRLLKVNGKK